MPSFDIHISGSISSSCFRSEAKHLLPEVVLYMGLPRLVDHNRTNLKGMLAYPQCLGNVCTRTTVIEVGHKAVAPASHILNPLVMSPRLVTRLFAAASHACPDQPSVCHAPRLVARLLLRPATCLPRSTLSVCHVTKVSHKAIAPASHILFLWQLESLNSFHNFMPRLPFTPLLRLNGTSCSLST